MPYNVNLYCYTGPDDIEKVGEAVVSNDNKIILIRNPTLKRVTTIVFWRDQHGNMHKEEHEF
jgi:hypothetical protein